MLENKDEKVQKFKSWARKNMERLKTATASVAADQISEELLRINEQLGVEVSEEIEENREAIITAFSESSLFSLVKEIVDELSDVPGWRFVALKPPRGFAFTISVGIQKLYAKTLEFSPIRGVDGGIYLVPSREVLDTLLSGDDLEEIAWLIVETGIGEELGGRIQQLEFVGKEQAGKCRPIEELEAFLLAGKNV